MPRPAGHTCTCTIDGYELAEDGETCKLTAQAAAARAAASSITSTRGNGSIVGVGGVLGITFLVLSVVTLVAYAAYRWKIKARLIARFVPSWLTICLWMTRGPTATTGPRA